MDLHPRRLLFIASIGNIQPPYRSTRHSAGHILLDALIPLLHKRIPPSALPFYTTWYSTAYMNESGPLLAKELKTWVFAPAQQQQQQHQQLQLHQGFPNAAARARATLVILHDELEAPLGRVRVRRGGPEASSLRGHRGLISVFETLRKKGLYRPSSSPSSSSSSSSCSSGTSASSSKGSLEGAEKDLSVLRVGIGIGRPPTREKDVVADYVLSKMNATELAAVRDAAGPVLQVLFEELFRGEGAGGGKQSWTAS